MSGRDQNCVMIIGRLTRDFETSYTAMGFCIGRGSVACNDRVKHNDQWVDEASYFDFKLLGKRAESLAQYLVRGQQVSVSGRLKQERWNDKQTNAQRSKIVIMANNVQLLGGKKDSGNSGGYQNNGYGQSNGNSGGYSQNSGTGFGGPDDFGDDIPF